MATSFQDGKKWVDGRAYEPLILKTNRSRTNPDREPYRTIFWADGRGSCNCTGWATHKHCRHVTDLLREVEYGILGNGVRDILRVARLSSEERGRFPFQSEPARPVRTRRRRDSSEYIVAPEVAAQPAVARATTIDGDKIEYRRIRL